MIQIARQKREKHEKLIQESIRKIPPLIMTKTRRKKFADDEQDMSSKAYKASLIQGVYKIVEHQLIND